MKRAWMGLSLVLLAACAQEVASERSDSTASGDGELSTLSVPPNADSPIRKAVAGVTGKATVDASAMRALQEWRRADRLAIRDWLQARAANGDGHAQLALALLHLQVSHPPTDPAALERHEQAQEAERDAAFVKALEMLPDDPLVNWLAASRCTDGDPRCDRQALEARLLELEPDNAAAWLSQLQRAFKDGDEAAINTALEGMALADRQDVHYTGLNRMLVEQLEGLPTSSLSARAAAAAGDMFAPGWPVTGEELRWMEIDAASAAYGFPPFHGLARACKPPVPQPRASLCRGAATRVASGDTLIDRAIGLTTQVRLTAGSAEGARWRERLREYYWQYEVFIDLHRSAAMTAEYLDRMMRSGEMAAVEWLLEQHGQSQPPPGWLPSDPRRRALVTTGSDPNDG